MILSRPERFKWDEFFVNCLIVGRLSMSQLSQEQVRVYINEEHNRRRNLLQKYIRLCNEAKVTVDTMLLESDATPKVILDLIPVLNITNLVMGTKRQPYSRYVRQMPLHCSGRLNLDDP
jgi:K+-sensing histidine kinase KdpD